MTDATSASSPATEMGQLPPAAWLRTALLAAVPAVLGATAVQLLLGSSILDHAVSLEGGYAVASEPFTRTEQHAGMVLGNLIFATGLAAMLAGALVLIGGTGAPRRRWLTAVSAGWWGVVVTPALVYPPLPPGVSTNLTIESRQVLFLACIVVGASSMVAAQLVWHRGARLRGGASVAILAVPLAVAMIVLPEQRLSLGELGGGTLDDFRLVAIGSQLVFWATLAVGGALLLRRSGRGGPSRSDRFVKWPPITCRGSETKAVDSGTHI